MKKHLLSCSFLLVSVLGFSQQPAGPASYVDPFIGTAGGGNTFMGASLPFGMVKAGPDCGRKNSNSGYIPGAEVHGFSHTHVSGTGGGPKYGNILVMPFTGEFVKGEISSMPGEYKASPGYMSVDLPEYGIFAELSCTQSVGVHRYHFPADKQKGILIDAGSFLGEGWCCGEAQELVGCEVKIISNTRIEGYSRVRGGWNKGGAYTVYFSAVFDTPASATGVWNGDHVLPEIRLVPDNELETGAYFLFGENSPEIINLKVGISFISTEIAYENISCEAGNTDFEEVRKNALSKWNSYLERINVETDDEELKKIFYTALYHSILMPSDRSGENPGWTGDSPYYDDFYAIWDTFRATHPLYMFLCPEKQVEIINALLGMYEKEGYMPDARSGNSPGRTQGGSNCDVLIADAFVKGLEGIDYEKAFEAMLRNAEDDPGFFHHAAGRGGLNDYKRLGYVPSSHERAGSRTVEYAYNDYCLYQLAKALGKNEEAEKYLERSGNWKNLWKPVSDHGATGFIMPKNAGGEWDASYRGRSWTPENGWQPADFTVHSGGTWSDFFYEADSWEYSFYIPHDVSGLIMKCGGRAAFISRLDTFFTNGYFSVGNEPSFLTTSLYNYAGRQDKTSDIIRYIISEKYFAGPAGIPGNDDSGSMSAWAAFHMLGFYPNAGQDFYLITAPHFEQATISLQSGKSLRIKTHNLSGVNKYINKVVLNGRELRRSWFSHSEIKNGGLLEFYMTNWPDNSWEEELPPSGKQEHTGINENRNY